jgi:hypothetical protein
MKENETGGTVTLVQETRNRSTYKHLDEERKGKRMEQARRCRIWGSHGGEYELLIVLMMEAASTSETSVNFYQTTRRYNPKESDLQVGT